MDALAGATPEHGHEQNTEESTDKDGAAGDARPHGDGFLSGAARSCNVPLSKYELTRALGARAAQLARGHRPRVTPPPHMLDPLEIACLELDAGVLDVQLQRVFPDGLAERWSVQELRRSGRVRLP